MSYTWDTTLPVFKYSNDSRKAYEYFYISQRKNFTNWIGKISKNFSSDIDWWSSSVASRNTFVSKLFHNICILESLLKLKKEGKCPSKIIVQSHELKKLINRHFKRNIDTQVITENNSSIKNIYFIFFPLIYAITILIFSRIFKNKNKIKNNNNNVLIDTFITSINLNSNRYYGQLEKKSLRHKNIYFVPTILYAKIIKIPSIIKNLRNKKNFLLKEDFINIKDIFHAFNYIFRKKKFNIKYISYKSLNLSDLIKEELSFYSDFQATLTSIINYRFAKNLKDKKIKIRKVVNWFENTAVDKGWNFGFRTFYPQTLSVGYQGYTLYRQFMCKHPSKAEYSYKVLPKVILTIGEVYRKIRKEFCNNLEIKVGPALRFKDLLSYKYKNIFLYNIVVILNLDISVSKEILENVINTEWSKTGKKIYIKSHPLLPLSKILPKKKLPEHFIEIKGSFSHIARNSKIIIGSGISSSIVESIFYGCAVLLPLIDKNEEYNFKYLKIPKESYKICSNKSQLNNGINYFLNEKKLNKKNRINKINLLKPKMFEKITEKNLNSFL